MCGEGGEGEGQERWSDLKVDGVILRSGRVEGHWPPLPGYASARGTARGTFSTPPDEVGVAIPKYFAYK